MLNVYTYIYIYRERESEIDMFIEEKTTSVQEITIKEQKMVLTRATQYKQIVSIPGYYQVIKFLL